MPSAAPLAALERRLDEAGGGVARLWGGLGDEDGDSALAGPSGAVRWWDVVGVGGDLFALLRCSTAV